VLSHRHVLLNRSLSHCVSQENYLEYHIISTLYTKETSTSFHLHLRENDTPNSWASSPRIGAHSVPSSYQREEPHTHLMRLHPTHGTPNSSPHTTAHNVPSLSQRGTTHPYHGHTQLMGFLTGRLTQSVSWRMSHDCNHQQLTRSYVSFLSIASISSFMACTQCSFIASSK
jgi:hypothetical protein